MKPLETDFHDAREMQSLGRASVQIIHDLKNQLNGLKLYATFLRKRLEKSDRPPDELETVLKLIAGLERAAADMNVLVRYGRRLDLRSQPQVNLSRILQSVFENGTINLSADEEEYTGSFDPEALAEAFQLIAEGPCKPQSVRLRVEDADGKRAAVAEWETRDQLAADPFASFAGSAGLRLALAAKIIRAHGGEAARTDSSTLAVRLPLAARAAE